jgi:hypothetical protein
VSNSCVGSHAVNSFPEIRIAISQRSPRQIHLGPVGIIGREIREQELFRALAAARSGRGGSTGRCVRRARSDMRARWQSVARLRRTAGSASRCCAKAPCRASVVNSFMCGPPGRTNITHNATRTIERRPESAWILTARRFCAQCVQRGPKPQKDKRPGRAKTRPCGVSSR